jgi:hypothetical protein
MSRLPSRPSRASSRPDPVPEATLPHGVLRDREWRRDAVLRRPTGADEAALAGRAASPAAGVSALLARCVETLGGEPAGEDVVRGLTVGDREALLLQLRGATFGDRLACVVVCRTCEERMDVELSLAELLVAPYDHVAQTHEVQGEDGARVRFRLPTGADQEAAAGAPDAEAGAALLLERCVMGAEVADPASVEAAMARLDPQSEVRLAADCPACGAPVDALLDAGALMLDELDGDDGLLREVHALARHYHWSEGEILALEVPRRRRYLELLVADEAAAGVAL